MKTYSVLCVLAVWVLTTAASYGQNDALIGGSAEAERALRKYEQGRGHSPAEATKQQKKTRATKNNLRTTAYDDFKEPYRTQFIEKWNEAVKEAKERVASARLGIAAARRAFKDDLRLGRTRGNQAKTRLVDARENLKKAKEYLKRLEKNDPPFIYIPNRGLPREPRDWGVGDTGVMSRNVKVIQVVSKDKLLISVSGLELHSRDRLVMLSGFQTDRITDGSIWSTDDPIKITGTTTYTTVNGSTNTVLAAVRTKPFDREAYIKSLKREAP